VDALVERKLLGLLGLGYRGRLVVVGVDRVRDAALSNKLRFAVVAPDASANSLDKIVPMLKARRVFYVEGPSAVALGNAVGKASTAVVGVVDAKLARGIREIVEASSVGARDAGPAGTQ
jgi:ribosomal protein L7Ae-like RNA K-turn-binding protein